MKLLFCKNCYDVFKLIRRSRKCKCGLTKGKYSDNLNATYTGEHAVPLGFSNFSLGNAILNQPESNRGKTFEAFVIPKNCETFIKQTNEIKSENRD